MTMRMIQGWAAVLVLGGGAAWAQGFDQEAATAATTTPPYALSQYATITGSGNTLTLNWLPVVTSSGTKYENVTLLFDVSSTGVLTVGSGYPSSVTAAPPVIANFKAGKYVGPSTIYYGEMLITVNGPGLAPGGMTEWTISAGTGAAGCTFPDTATWYVSSIANNPLAARLKTAGITSTAWSYGIGSSDCATSYNKSAWYPNTLMGISQVGNSLSMASFTDSIGKDHPEPVDVITYTFSQ